MRTLFFVLTQPFCIDTRRNFAQMQKSPPLVFCICVKYRTFAVAKGHIKPSQTTMNDLSYIHLNINLVYVAIFSLLGLFIYFVHVPKDVQFSGYRKSRITLSSAFIFMSVCCTVRFFMPEHHNDFVNFWLLTTCSIIFAWLNYTSFLYLIDTEFCIRKNFVIDGVAPIVLMMGIGIIGIAFTQYQKFSEYALGIVFLTKCIRMFYVCEREWQRVDQEQQNFYDEKVDIEWMRILIWITLALSLCTFTALYIPAIHIFNDYVAPIAYIYMTIKIVNYLPRKIDEMRIGNESITEKREEVPMPLSEQKRNGLEEKVGIYLDRWVKEKRYCTAELSIKDVATQIGTNHSYLSQYLNTNLGVSFQTWLNTLRIEESKHILTTENISIENVGIKVGIPESYNFSRWFKVVTGTTPLRFRREGGEKQIPAF